MPKRLSDVFQIDAVILRDYNIFRSSSPTWKDIINKKDKNIIKKIIMENPELMKSLLDKYKAKSAYPYNFESDPNGEFRWHDIAREYANKFPLTLRDFESESNEKIVDIICQHFSNLVAKGLCTEFYKKSGEPNSEKIGQLILLELLDNYVDGSSFQVTHDFKNGNINLSNLSFSSEINFLLKYTSTPRLIKFYEKTMIAIENIPMLSYTTLILIRLNGGKAVIDTIDNLDREHRQEKIKLFRRFDIDGRSQGTGRIRR
jgi:hypothetical protein